MGNKQKKKKEKKEEEVENEEREEKEENGLTSRTVLCDRALSPLRLEGQKADS